MQGQPFLALVYPFVQICLLRLRPQDLPLSTFLMVLTMTAYTLTSIAALAALRLPLGQALLAGTAATLLLAALTASLLAVQSKLPRLTQTLTALAGSGTVLNIVATPFALFLKPPDGEIHVSAATAFAFSLLMLWSFTITGHVLRHAISSSFFLGLMLAIVFNLVSDQVLGMLFDFNSVAP